MSSVLHPSDMEQYKQLTKLPRLGLVNENKFFDKANQERFVLALNDAIIFVRDISRDAKNGGYELFAYPNQGIDKDVKPISLAKVMYEVDNDIESRKINHPNNSLEKPNQIVYITSINNSIYVVTSRGYVYSHSMRQTSNPANPYVVGSGNLLNVSNLRSNLSVANEGYHYSENFQLYHTWKTKGNFIYVALYDNILIIDTLSSTSTLLGLNLPKFSLAVNGNNSTNEYWLNLLSSAELVLNSDGIPVGFLVSQEWYNYVEEASHYRATTDGWVKLPAYSNFYDEFQEFNSNTVKSSTIDNLTKKEFVNGSTTPIDSNGIRTVLTGTLEKEILYYPVVKNGNSYTLVMSNDKLSPMFNSVFKLPDIPQTYFTKEAIDVYRNREYLNTINQTTLVGNRLFVGSFNGWVYQTDLVRDNSGSITGSINTKSLLRLDGSPSKFSYVNGYLFVLHDNGEIRVWNESQKREEVIYLEQHGVDMDTNGFFLYVTIDGSSYNVYKIVDLPFVQPDIGDSGPGEDSPNKKIYAVIEKDNKSEFNQNYYLNNRIAVSYPGTPSKNIKHRYRVDLFYRGSDSASHLFYEPNQYANVYIPLRDIWTNIVNEMTFKLDEKPIRFNIVDMDSGLTVVVENSDGNDILYKIGIKDVYYYEDSTYFRMRYLLDANKNPYTLQLRLGNSITMIYNGQSELQQRAKYEQMIPGINKWYTNTDFDQFVNKFTWFKFNDTDYEHKPEIEFTLYQNGNKIDTYKHKYNQKYVDPSNVIDSSTKESNLPPVVKWIDTDGSIHVIEDLYLNDLEHGDKTSLQNGDKRNGFYDHMSNISYETLSTGNTVPVTKANILGNGRFINNEKSWGMLDLSTQYDGFQNKADSRIGDVYIDGLRIYRNAFIQEDNLEGMLFTYASVRKLKHILNIENLNSGSSLPSEKQIISTGTKYRMSTAENFVTEYTITDEFEPQSQMIASIGIYLDGSVTSNLVPNELKVYIKKEVNGIYHQLNPGRYYLWMDTESNLLHLTVYGNSLLMPGSKVLVKAAGIRNNTITVTGDTLRVGRQVSSIPLLSTDDRGNAISPDIMSPDDLEVNINGYTLYPGSDYNIMLPGKTINSQTGTDLPPMVVLRNSITVTEDLTIEVNTRNIGQNKTFVWNKPAEGTSDIFSLDDERWTFIPGSFEVFVGNRRIPISAVSIISHRSIRIKPDSYYSKLENVMVRFSYSTHTNLQLIIDWYKFSKFDPKDNYYHSAFTKAHSILDEMGNGDNAVINARDVNSPSDSNDLHKLALMNKIYEKPEIRVDPAIYKKYTDMIQQKSKEIRKSVYELRVTMQEALMKIKDLQGKLDNDDSGQAEVDRLNKELAKFIKETTIQLDNLNDKLIKTQSEFLKAKLNGENYTSIDKMTEADYWIKKSIDLKKQADDIIRAISDLKKKIEDTTKYYKDLIQKTKDNGAAIHQDLINKISEQQDIYDKSNKQIEDLLKEFDEYEAKVLKEQQSEIDKIVIPSDGSHSTTIDTNQPDIINWDTFIDAQPFVNDYLTYNLFLDMNPGISWNKAKTWDDPEI